MINDLTKGAPLKLMLLFSIPLLIGNIFQQFYNIADIIIVGRTLGMTALASVGAVSPLFFLIMFIIVGMTNGFAVITGQRFGAKDYEGVRRSVTMSTILSTVFTITFTIICAAAMHHILFLMNVPQEIYKDAYYYIQIVVIGLIVANFYNLLASIIRALGDSMTPLYCLIIASVLNIFLALLFILEFHMGVPGSAFALVLSQAFSALLCVWYVKKHFPILHLKKKDWIIDWKKEFNFALAHLKVGIPMAVQFGILGLSLLIIQSVCNTFGPDVIAAFTAALRIEQMATLPMISFGVALAAYVAQNFGAGNFSRIRFGVKKASLINVILSIVMAFIMHFWGGHLVRIFVGYQNEDIVKIAHDYLFRSSLFYFFLAQIFIYRNALQGLGRAVIPMLAAVGELLMRAFAAIYLAAKIGYFGVFYAGPIAWVAASIVLAAGYYSTIKQFILKTQQKLRKNRRVS
ncbi:TPA: MATE family efflux transporter [Candidatus Gastranaerophilales bacterium HUM_3]|nr:MAG TPA: MATE family efflux transporter [Candidatus Gastranaerophilales bacterium HUM_3]DAA84884.1 MAG TPA: MATE family efflux transporter [Candidatus Gastranaerophilales bacterium HUM_4]DAA91026.1 MAG TPA: MATE family efflux transporter [Candidatus Gastranaerophilales bacterium HUM_5]DAA94453.1 MAG TPA: MATE family efflux transporter [Candidatus Gastranaerophilales bacterium HUM_8]DAB00920.1 MAG TPA: MATE family efflux transporter [Candidatus Gastranaerophilales bacterium HUM_11]DAB10737.1